MVNTYIHVRIISPQQLLLDTQALSVSSKNSAGSFDVLANHANFISLIENSDIKIRLPNRDMAIFKFPMAIIYVTDNKVNIYTYIQHSPDKK